MKNSERVGVHIPVDYQPAADALAGRIIMVTGATAGIGRSAALAYAKHGATVVLVGRSEERLVDIYDAIEAAGGPSRSRSPSTSTAIASRTTPPWRPPWARHYRAWTGYC